MALRLLQPPPTPGNLQVTGEFYQDDPMSMMHRTGYKGFLSFIWKAWKLHRWAKKTGMKSTFTYRVPFDKFWG